ncbi:hypothetical protein B0H67DRAFT_638534 [Lasiosphaeris hirsuta]|uniref:Uncharacterized protein n=1 Tax=Lasiosphaeris hirsuta TaxID=260670 RepID=A0AA40B9B0_9PEZI|nr:hypothetical protein B0H67DRAFT_638534 [Lasiosphaeris hirsuta]
MAYNGGYDGGPGGRPQYGGGQGGQRPPPQRQYPPGPPGPQQYNAPPQQYDQYQDGYGYDEYGNGYDQGYGGQYDDINYADRGGPPGPDYPPQEYYDPGPNGQMRGVLPRVAEGDTDRPVAADTHKAPQVPQVPVGVTRPKAAAVDRVLLTELGNRILVCVGRQRMGLVL